MSRLFDGLIMVTGERDVGKTTFGLECGTPLPKIEFFDHDIKTGVLLNQLDTTFRKYHNLVEARKGKTEIQFHDHCMKLIEEIPTPVETIIWDNYTPFEDTFYPKVMQDPNKYRQTWASMGAVKGAQQWDASFQLGEQVLDLLMQKAPLVILIFHLKFQNIGGVRTEKMIPAAKRVVPQKANMTLWLRMNEQGGGAPVGLVLKRIGKATSNAKKEFKMVNVLPRKINPCTWAKIREYWENPVGMRVEEKLEKDELPNDHELSILDGTFTPDQRKSFELMLKYGQKDEEEAAMVEAAANAEAIKTYKSENPEASPVDIKSALGLSLSVPAIIKIVQSVEEE